MDDKTKKEIFSIPNILSYFRIALIPVFVVLYVHSYDGVGYHFAAVGVLILSGITDFLDGKIARSCNMITEWGKIIDPVADKLTQAAIMVCLAIHYKLLIPVIAFLIVKEITMAVLGLVFLKKGRKLKGAHWYGKVATTVFYLVMLALLIVPYSKMPSPLSTVLILISGAFMVFSFIMYIRVYINMGKDIKANNPNKRY